MVVAWFACRRYRMHGIAGPLRESEKLNDFSLVVNCPKRPYLFHSTGESCEDSQAYGQLNFNDSPQKGPGGFIPE